MVQFINILDFVMVMPLGPDFARALDIPSSHIGYVGGAYTAAAAVSGVACSFFLDRFDRRPALALALLGLCAGTAAGGMATGLPSLLASRVVAGLFGGPATSLAFSIIADVIPAERRGRAVGAVMGAFSAASVLGVPAGLELARIGGWHLPFFAVAGLGVLFTALSHRLLPSLTLHLRGDDGPQVSVRELVSRPLVRWSYLMTALVMAGGFLIIPSISPYVQENLHYPRGKLGMLYLCGGVVSFFTTRYGGRLVDRIGSYGTSVISVACFLPVLYLMFVLVPPPLPMPVLFMAFMLAMGLRNVAYNTLTSKVPRPNERARFLSFQSAVQHIAAAAGAFLAARLLTEAPNRTLIGITRVVWISMVMAVLVPVVVLLVERRVVGDATDRDGAA